MTDLRVAEFHALRDDLVRTKDVLGMLISWMVQSANSPIRREEADELIRQLLDDARRES